MTRQARVPAAAADYFGCGTNPPIADHPVIGQVFRPGKGWLRYPWRKRVSGSEIARLRAHGVTHVALDWHGRRADFTVTELSRRPR